MTASLSISQTAAVKQGLGIQPSIKRQKIFQLISHL